MCRPGRSFREVCRCVPQIALIASFRVWRHTNGIMYVSSKVHETAESCLEVRMSSVNRDDTSPCHILCSWLGNFVRSASKSADLRILTCTTPDGECSLWGKSFSLDRPGLLHPVAFMVGISRETMKGHKFRAAGGRGRVG